MTKFTDLVHHKGGQETTKKIKPKTDSQKPTAFYLVLSLVIVVGLSYLIFVNKVATDGYQVKELSGKIEALGADYKKLELEASSLQSMSNINDLSQSLDLVSIKEMDYISSSGTVVAYK